MKSAPPIGFDYRPSRWLLLAVFAILLLALAAIEVSGLPAWLRTPGWLLAGMFAGIGIGCLLRPRVHSVLWRADGGVTLGLRDTVLDGGGEVNAELHHARVLGPLVMLDLRWGQNDRAQLWLLPDNLDADTRRRLRVRIGAQAGAIAAA
jgi:toxin CptA